VNRQLGPYLLLRELGRGGMGIVYAARHAQLGRDVALKVMSADLGTADAQAVARFRREAETAGRLRHPGIVQVHDFGQAGGQLYLAMDLVEGESLASRLKRGPLPWAEAGALLLQVTRAVAHAHAAGVLHRDLKPDNILIDASGCPRVTDFGIARDLSDARERLTRTGQMLGTPAFMPPEQASGEKAFVGPASDVYALGATLYAALAGRPPFDGPVMVVVKKVLTDPPPPLEGLPAPLAAVLDRCLEKHASDRYPDAGALAVALEEALAASDEGTATPPRRAPVVAAVVGALVVVAGVLAFALGRREVEATTTTTPTTTPPPVTAAPAPYVPKLLVGRWREVARDAGAPWPAARVRHAMTYDPVGHGVIVHGGDRFSDRRDEVALGDTWRWSGAWERLSTEDLVRTRHAIAFVEATGALLLMGGTPWTHDGQVTSAAMSDHALWDRDARRWVQAEPKQDEDWRGRFWHAMAARGREVVLMGGLHPEGTAWRGLSDAWAFDGERWRPLEDAPRPKADFILVPDPRSGDLLALFGCKPARDYVSEDATNLALGPAGWRRLDDPAIPPPRRGAAAVVADVAGRQTVVIFGGLRARDAPEHRLDETWILDVDGWRELPLSDRVRPPALLWHALAYDRERKAVVLFGGSEKHAQVSDEVWELRLTLE
jgi:hypothetical protein